MLGFSYCFVVSWLCLHDAMLMEMALSSQTYAFSILRCFAVPWLRLAHVNSNNIVTRLQKCGKNYL